mgnify:CR=1 FL=1
MITSSNVEIHNFSKWDEQSWRMSTSSNGLKIEIESFSYWGFGLFSSGYANKITLSSQEEVGNRLIFDVISSLDFTGFIFIKSTLVLSSVISSFESSVTIFWSLGRS